MFTSLDLFPLSKDIKTCLKLHGFSTAEDCFYFTPEELKKVLRLDLQKCNNIIEVISKNNYSGILDVKIETALDNYLHFTKKVPIISLCESIDNLLGGFFTGQIIEIFGESGTGKTQLCLQLCCNVQIPKYLGGNEGQAFYIDTENSFRPERLAQICQETIDTLKFSTNQIEINLTTENMLNNVKFIYCNHPNKLAALILYHLETHIKENQNIKLIVLDSVAYQFRYGFDDDKKERTKILVELSQKFKYLAYKYNICIILVNQVTYKLNCDGLIAALDSVWGHTASIQLKLNKSENNLKYAQLKKGIFANQKKAFYKITKSGIIDVNVDNIKNMNDFCETSKETTQKMSKLFSQIYEEN